MRVVGYEAQNRFRIPDMIIFLLHYPNHHFHCKVHGKKGQNELVSAWQWCLLLGTQSGEKIGSVARALPEIFLHCNQLIVSSLTLP